VIVKGVGHRGDLDHQDGFHGRPVKAAVTGARGVRVHLVDGTYELFRHFFGAPPRAGVDGVEIGAVRGVLSTVVAMLGDGATHVGVATDHVIESFRNDMWPGYKTGSGIDPVLRAQFVPLEEALVALGVCVWAMVDLEADDALASAAAVAADDPAVDQVIICTPDKDLAQCVVNRRVVQLDRRAGTIADEDGVRAKFGVDPESIPDWLALVGDSADGFPGISGWGKKTAAVVLAHYGHIAAIPDRAADWEPRVVRSVRGAATLAARLAEERATAMLFRDLATLRVDRSLLATVDDLSWRGPTPAFAEVCRNLRDPGLADRAAALSHL
jgi:5'-3' exonuclease